MLIFLCYFSFFSFSTIHCASFTKSSINNNNTSSESGEDYHDREIYKSEGLERNLLHPYPVPLQNNHPLFQAHQNMMLANNGFLNPQIVPNIYSTSASYMPSSIKDKVKKDKRGGTKKRITEKDKDSSLELEDEEIDEETKTVKKQLEKTNMKDNDTALWDPKSKTDDGNDKDSARACPACGGSDCSTNNNISGLPIIQILAAIKAGLIWAKIFLYLYKNFISQSKPEESNSGYGYDPAPAPAQYGPPQPSYGPPQPQYGPPSSHGYSNRVGFNARKSSSTDSIAEMALKAINMLSKAYEDG